MKLNGRMRGFARALIVALSLVTPGFLAPVAEAAPAVVQTDVSAAPGVEPRCDRSPYYLCLYYNGSNSAWWGTSVSVPDLAGHTFFPFTGEGSGLPVKNNAADVSCDASPTSICLVFANPGYTGSRDWRYGQTTTRLLSTYKANAAVSVSFGA